MDVQWYILVVKNMEISKLILLSCSLNKLLCTVCRGEIRGMGSNDAMHHDHPQY